MAALTETGTRPDLDEVREASRLRVEAKRVALLELAQRVGLSTEARELRTPEALAGVLTFTVRDQSPQREDVFPLESAIATTLIEAHEITSGERVAYMKVSHTTDALVAATWTDALHFMTSRGWHLSFDDPAQLWLQAHLHARAVPASMNERGRRLASHQLGAEHIPDESTIRSDLSALAARYEPDMAEWVTFFRVPYVAYSNISAPRWRRRGLGAVLYEITARELARSGRVLRASGIQSDDALGLWERLTANPAYPTGTVTLPSGGEQRCYQTLDYRNG